MDIQEFFQSVIERIQGNANTKAVYGEPITAQGKTVIPVAKVSYCFGGGSGECPECAGKEHGEGKPYTKGEGGGGGGGIKVKPVGVVVVTPKCTHFVSVHEEKKLAIAMAVGLYLGICIGKRICCRK